MNTQSNFSVVNTNSFGVKSIAPIAYFPSSIDDLVKISELPLTSFYILGEGFNSLFVEDKSPVIIKPNFKGIEIQEQADCTIVRVAASENWHELVGLCINKGINGLENLALIPGSVGAAPVQNIGAYGVELSDYCVSIEWFDFSKKRTLTYLKEQCKFGYRESIFKHALKNKGLITHVTFCFPKKWQANLSYVGLDHLPIDTCAEDVMHAVVAIRQSKLPDPIKLPNAGSFFKNPVIDYSQWQKLIEQYPNMPSYHQKVTLGQSKKVKIAAGWLIEQAGLKGYEENGVGVHQQQALVLVNYSTKKGSNIANLAVLVRNKVLSKFNIPLEPEVRAVFEKGEMSLIQTLSENYVESLNG